MASKIIVALIVMIAVAAALPAQQPALNTWPAAGGVNPWIPPWVSSMPWLPQWSPCTGVGSTCVDCTTKLVCTKIGGIQKACSDPTLPYCNLGQCSATPTDECAPPPPPEVPTGPVPI